MADLLQLIEHEIPEARRNILESHTNLSKVADYCEDNYIQADEKNRRHALEETKNYTTQSLASVAYQINTLATNFLQLLDMQTHQLAEMESHINHLSETVMIHKEKVARREIGVLTTNKTATRPPGVKTPGIIFPDHQERPVKYVRKAIDYTALDEVGNGVKVQNPRKRESITSTGSQRSSVSMSSSSHGPAPTTKPPTPPTGTIGRAAGGGIYRQGNMRPAAPPAPPSHYMSSQQLKQVAAPEPPSHYQHGLQYQQAEPVKKSPYQQGMQYQQPADAVQPSPYQQGIQYQQTKRTSTSYASPAHPAQPPPPPPPPMVGVALPMSSQVQPMSPPAPPPPPLPQSSVDSYIQDINDPPPPPPMSAGFQAGNMSPPLPPPPEEDFIPPPPPPTFGDQRSYDNAQNLEGDQSWIPETYLEKCLAVYDYEKDKDDELELKEDAVIYVIKKNEDGWWEGVMDGQTGLFPSNYVEPCI